MHRSYRPRHTIGRLWFLECEAFDEAGAPTDDMTPWKEVCSPYDVSLCVREDGCELKAQTHRDFLGDDIVETYPYTEDGVVGVAIEHRSRGYRREHTLGSLA